MGINLYFILTFYILFVISLSSVVGLLTPANVIKCRLLGITSLRTQTHSGTETDVGETETIETPPEIQPKVTWTACAKGTVRVKDQIRTVEDYMSLPASQYSVLTADQIVRLSDSEFKCTLGTMNFFGTKITPVLFVDVNVYPEEAKSVISVTRAETTGSEIAEKVNGTFSISAINTVRAGRDKNNVKTLSSETNLKIDVIVPSTNLPLRVIQSGGNFIMQSTLSIIVQAFVRILAADFKRWSAGNDSRDAVGDVKLG